jgi:hypothetical protein
MGCQVETCRTSGHDWLQILGGKRCMRCGEQRAEPVKLLTGHVANAHELAILHEMNLIYEIIGLMEFLYKRPRP